MVWTIEIAQFPLPIPLANGIASHAFWVLKNDGVVVAELQGLATGRNDVINPMGGPLDTSDTIGMYNVTSETLLTSKFGVFNGQFMSTWSDVTSNTVWSGTQADAAARWDLAASVTRVINDLNIDYGPLAINGFNSNSVAEMTGDLLGFPDVLPPTKADGNNPWATGWDKNIATKVVSGILYSIEAQENKLGRPLTADELKPYSDLIEKFQPAKDSCFLAGTMIDMWPLEIQPGPDGRYDEAAIRAKVWQKPIEEITPNDWVVSFDKQGKLKPGKVARTFTNESKIILDFHGTFVTPGHVYYCAGGKYEGRFAPLIDILRDDGVIRHQDGTLIRATTGCTVGSADDEEFWVFKLTTDDQGNERVCGKTKLRFGTRWMLPNGNHFSMREYLDGIGVEIIREGSQQSYARWKETGIVTIFAWTLSDTLPKPEDFILARSATTLEEIYKASQWETQRPTMPPPMVMDGGPVQPLPERGLKLMPRNEPLAFGGSPSSQLQYDSNPQMNRRQRKIAEAKSRQATKNKRPKGATLH